MKQLYIIRGVSGSGKSTLAMSLAMLYRQSKFNVFDCEADAYHIVDGEYKFNPDNIHKAHQACQMTCEMGMKMDAVVIVSNTTTTEKDMRPYLDLAEKYGYNVTSLIVENRHGGKDKHNVPEETLQKQERNLRNSIKLR